MLTRRGFAACALCAISGFTASAAEQQPVATTPGLKRTLLGRIDGPAPGYETVSVLVEVEPDVAIARHTHPGVESSYILEGGLELQVEGQPMRKVSPGEGVQVAAGVPHGGKNGSKTTRLAATYIVEKGKPLASPA